MENENLEEITNLLIQTDIEDNPVSENHYKSIYRYKPEPKTRHIVPEPIDFEKYVQENCESKLKILDRSTFHEIKRPTIIFFNHFREKCVHHSESLDRMYQLALKYGDQIEFIAADIIDIDVMNPKWNPLRHFCRLVSPERGHSSIFAIDEKRRIHEHNDPYKTDEKLYELCENLLNAKLYPSQKVTENNNEKLVKICVHDNFEDVILKSTKDVLLVCNLEEYLQNDPNYENVALQLKDYNVEIVYMEGEVNYIPFEYNVHGFPTILFIPHNDKNNFVYFENIITEENLVAFVKELVENPEVLKLKQEEQQKRYCLHKPLDIPNDFVMDFMDLPQFLEESFKNTIKVLDRKSFDKIKNYILIIYMNFQGKCLAHHIRWLDKIYQVAVNSYSIQYLVADFKDIDIINTKWKPKDFITTANPKAEIPKIFAIDQSKHTYKLPDFKSVPSLFYFETSLTRGELYFSECYPRNQDDQLVLKCVADSLNTILNQSKRDLFITFYDPDHKDAEKLLNILEEVAGDIKNKNFCVKVLKLNVKDNYVDLEYAYHTYPVHYFISRHNKKENIRFLDCGLNKDKMLEFIQDCMQKY